MHKISRKLAANWQTIDQLPYSLKREPVASWLMETTSMTHRLRQHCQEQLNVTVLQHKVDKTRPNERQLLALKSEQPAIVREIILMDSTKPLIFARSIYPLPSLIGKNSALRHLASKPIGDIMYQDRQLTRDKLEFCVLKPGQQDFNRACSQLTRLPDKLIGRRCVFHLHGKPILISEFFLPTLLQ